MWSLPLARSASHRLGVYYAAVIAIFKMRLYLVLGQGVWLRIENLLLYRTHHLSIAHQFPPLQSASIPRTIINTQTHKHSLSQPTMVRHHRPPTTSSSSTQPQGPPPARRQVPSRQNELVLGLEAVDEVYMRLYERACVRNT